MFSSISINQSINRHINKAILLLHGVLGNNRDVHSLWVPPGPGWKKSTDLLHCGWHGEVQELTIWPPVWCCCCWSNMAESRESPRRAQYLLENIIMAGCILGTGSGPPFFFRWEDAMENRAPVLSTLWANCSCPPPLGVRLEYVLPASAKPLYIVWQRARHRTFPLALLLTSRLIYTRW